MTVEVTRTVTVDIPAEEVWDLLADPRTRAMAITLVQDFDVEVADDIDGDEIVWHVGLPIPMIEETIAVRTREVERRENEYVRYTGESSVFELVGDPRPRGPGGWKPSCGTSSPSRASCPASRPTWNGRWRTSSMP
ncbi:MAG: hypothetical protein U5K37_11650 [Natrialbaceae archaeon]|nr:hypothetical protein [Natrialbaceae archaeon]